MQRAVLPILVLVLQGCSSVPEIKHTRHSFPPNAFTHEPKRPFEKLGLVRARASYVTLDPNQEEDWLCVNYYNRAVRDLLKFARDAGGNGVVSVRSVTYLMDGRQEMHPTAECTDDGEGGEVLVQGIAVKWLPAK